MNMPSIKPNVSCAKSLSVVPTGFIHLFAVFYEVSYAKSCYCLVLFVWHISRSYDLADIFYRPCSKPVCIRHSSPFTIFDAPECNNMLSMDKHTYPEHEFLFCHFFSFGVSKSVLIIASFSFLLRPFNHRLPIASFLLPLSSPSLYSFLYLTKHFFKPKNYLLV